MSYKPSGGRPDYLEFPRETRERIAPTEKRDAQKAHPSGWGGRQLTLPFVLAPLTNRGVTYHDPLPSKDRRS